MNVITGQSTTFHTAETLQQVVDILKQTTSKNFTISLSNSQINDIILRLSKSEQHELFPSVCSLVNVLQSLQVLRKHQLIQRENATKMILDTFISQIELYVDLFPKLPINYVTTLNTPPGQDASSISFQVTIQNTVVVTGGSLRNVGIGKRETVVGFLINISILSRICERELLESNRKTNKTNEVNIYVECNNSTIKQMTSLFFEKSGLRIIQNNPRFKGNERQVVEKGFKWVRVKITESPKEITFDNIEFGPTKVSLTFYDGDLFVSDKGSMSVLDAVTCCIDYASKFKSTSVLPPYATLITKKVIEDGESHNQIVEQTQENLIPIVDVSKTILQAFFDVGLRQLLHDIQNQRYFDPRQFNRIQRTLTNLNSYVEDVTFGSTLSQLQLFYSSVDNCYFPVILHPPTTNL
ncbi:hypothetical protein QTN25_001710 [Entamoeba marina]